MQNRPTIGCGLAALERSTKMPTSHPHLPTTIRDEDHLEDLLSEPTSGAVETLGRLEGDIIILGAGGKMGPTLARMARKASERAGMQRRIIGVSRFSTPGLEERLRASGVDTVRCDLLDPQQVEKLPDAPNVIFMAGMKFGTTGQQALTWAMNTHVPALAARKYAQSRIVAFSTGNVYGMSPVRLGGSLETDELQPIGEYALSCLGRERILEYFSRTQNTAMALLRLYYAHEMRYGVMVDIALKVKNRQPIDVRMGHFNAIWQADANAMALQAFDHVAVPPAVINIAGPELLSVRRIAAEFGRQFGVDVTFDATEQEEAFLGNGQRCQQLFGYPRVSVGEMIAWIADWIKHDKKLLDKPTHFENRQGKY